MAPTTLPGPVVLAPMAGGAGTPELVAAVGEAGALGFLAAGYLPVGRLADQIAAVRERRVPFGVNIFVPNPDRADPDEVASYADRLAPEAVRLGVRLGEPTWTDDQYEEKLDLLVGVGVPVVSFTFGCPCAQDVTALHRAGTEVLVTVTSPAEALTAANSGADGLVLQGVEAGGHRGGWLDGEQYGLLALIRLVRSMVDLPVVAAGGIADATAVRAVLAAGATAAAAGTAFLRCPESGAAQPYKDALVAREFAATTLTTAFSGRPARGLVNRFTERYGHAAPTGYPEIHHLTRPLRAAAAEAKDPAGMAMWAGQAHALAREAPAADVVRDLTP
jgi:nitronate monooxygenase